MESHQLAVHSLDIGAILTRSHMSLQVQEDFAFGISAELTRLRTAEKARSNSRLELLLIQSEYVAIAMIVKSVVVVEEQYLCCTGECSCERAHKISRCSGKPAGKNTLYLLVMTSRRTVYSNPDLVCCLCVLWISDMGFVTADDRSGCQVPGVTTGSIGCSGDSTDPSLYGAV